jgi:hypothetical protein
MVRLPDGKRQQLERWVQQYPGLSDRALARGAGVSHRTIGQWRRKLGAPRVPSPRMPEVERLTLALARQHQHADLTRLAQAVEPQFRAARARTLEDLAAWLLRYAQALRPQTAKPLAREQPRAVPKPGRRSGSE